MSIIILIAGLVIWLATPLTALGVVLFGIGAFLIVAQIVLFAIIFGIAIKTGKRASVRFF
jgi:hypothetical protein